MLVSVLPSRRLGVAERDAALRFGVADQAEKWSTRYLFRAGNPAFELSYWCGTCSFLFERQSGANGTMSETLGVLDELEGPVESFADGFFARFSSLLPEGDFLPLLLEVEPELVAPHDERDYFTHEQVETWGVDDFWGLPENPRSFYYRTFETRVAPDEHLYEFVVPMVPPSWNDRGRVEHYMDLMDHGVTPTAVALSTLDICQPADDDDSRDYYAHWGLTHFLLDGHHKLEAAARAGQRVRLLALVSKGGSLATPEDISRLPELLRQSRAPRQRQP